MISGELGNGSITLRRIASATNEIAVLFERLLYNGIGFGEVRIVGDENDYEWPGILSCFVFSKKACLIQRNALTAGRRNKVRGGEG